MAYVCRLLSPFAAWCDCIIVDDGFLSTVGNDGSECSVRKITVLSETGDASATKSSDVSTLDSGFSCDKRVTWSDFVLSVDNHESMKYERMFT